jgi:hypothetical protein
MGHFVKVCGSVSGCFKLVNPKFASREGKSLGELCCRFLLMKADVPASSADTLANDVVIRLRNVETSAVCSLLSMSFPSSISITLCLSGGSIYETRLGRSGITK